MDITLTPVEDKKRENVYLFNLRINYHTCFHRILNIEANDDNFYEIYLEIMAFNMSKNLNIFKKAYEENQLGEHFKWLKDINFNLTDKDEVDTLTIFYYNNEREKFTVKIEGDEAICEEIWASYDNLENDNQVPEIAIQFIEKYTLEQKLKTAKNGKKLKL